ncbi:PREDICTED: protein NUCLEAR FUSION DEFECTIVE 4-like [Tarenaya hassleriana]|uniref:protein NUCLEAR FUSION DEFECTIVE 4-like n=1 Tax=Tarenaya hassleriana TaxID=28532 RepID=UPI00053C6463|nr:PREDICTED: protein NUCLEAR FUSION DEFECTIVE 4-like [Tarenaya hassleriana]XP_010537921.1 PREDICTED: protein NUCLEAR FUSION DEFECTIVE 4-like [Tarenaya hassleriana]
MNAEHSRISSQTHQKRNQRTLFLSEMPKLVIKSGSRPPWVGLAAAVWLEISAGNGSNFPLYSNALKSVLGYNQRQLTLLGVANDVGESVGLLPGYACNKFPPWKVLLVGACACFLGYGVIWLTVTEIVRGLPFWLLWIVLIIATNSNAWFGTAVLVTNMKNFPLSRGTVAGILKGYAGIAAAVYTVIYDVLLNKSPPKLLLFLALGIPVICFAMMYFIRPCTPASGEDSSEHVHFVFAQAMSILVAVLVLAITLLGNFISLSGTVLYTLVAIMVVLLASPLAIPIKMTLLRKKPKRVNPPPPADPSKDSCQAEEDDTEQTYPLLKPSSSSASFLGTFIEMDDTSDVETLLAEGEGAVEEKRRPRRGEDFKLGEAFVKADFWLLWFLYFLGVGPGVTVLNNLAQIGIALGVDDTTILLCLFSFFNFAGRLGSGAISEHFVRSRAMPRTVWMTVAQIAMVIAFLLYAVSLTGSLYPATALLGTCYGFQYSLMVPTASELFGLKHFGLIYNFVLLGNPIGAFLFSSLLAGHLYDAEASRQGNSTCYGPECFRVTFLMLAGVSAMGAMLGVILTVRIRPVYRSLYASGSFRLP